MKTTPPCWPMRIGKQEAATGFAPPHAPIRKARLLGTVTTLEDVTRLQETDRFKTQFIGVASASCASALSLRPRPLRLNQGFAASCGPSRQNWWPLASSETEKLDDLMRDLIEVAELDTANANSNLSAASLMEVPGVASSLAALGEAATASADESYSETLRWPSVASPDLAGGPADAALWRSSSITLSNGFAYRPGR